MATFRTVELEKSDRQTSINEYIEAEHEKNRILKKILNLIFLVALFQKSW